MVSAHEGEHHVTMSLYYWPPITIERQEANAKERAAYNWGTAARSLHADVTHDRAACRVSAAQTARHTTHSMPTVKALYTRKTRDATKGHVGEN